MGWRLQLIPEGIIRLNSGETDILHRENPEPEKGILRLQNDSAVQAREVQGLC